MKLRPCSDLHLEWSPISLSPIGEDVMILAGDIAPHTEAMDLAKRMAEVFDIAIVYVAGNHEFYRCHELPNHTWEGTIDDLRVAADHTDRIEKGKVTFFEDSTAIYDGVRFIGATLWTDMLLYGDDPLVKMQVWRAMNDYNLIHSKHNHRLLIEQVVERHGVSRKFIEDTMAEPFDGPTVVVTHHTPSWLSVPPHYRSNVVSAGYSSRLESLIDKGKPKLWIHGHTHTSFDYELYETRVVCNPRGYVNVGQDIAENNEFKPDLLIEV